ASGGTKRPRSYVTPGIHEDAGGEGWARLVTASHHGINPQALVSGTTAASSETSTTSAVATRSLPSRLAAYSAASAACSNSFADVPWVGSAATPTETVITPTDCP